MLATVRHIKISRTDLGMTVRGADRPGGHTRQAQLERHHMRPFAAPNSTTGTVTSTNALHRDADPAAPPPFPQHSPRRRLGHRMPVSSPARESYVDGG